MTTQNTNGISPSFSSPDDFFIPNPRANAASAFDAATALLSQAESALNALMAIHTDPQGDHLTSTELVSFLWGIQTQVGMTQTALAHIANNKEDWFKKEDGNHAKS